MSLRIIFHHFIAGSSQQEAATDCHTDLDTISNHYNLARYTLSDLYNAERSAEGFICTESIHEVEPEWSV